MSAAELIAALKKLPPDTIIALPDGGVYCHVSPELEADQWGVASLRSTGAPVTEEDVQ